MVLMQVNYIGLQPIINLPGHRSNFPVPWMALVDPGVDTPLVPRSLIPCCIKYTCCLFSKWKVSCCTGGPFHAQVILITLDHLIAVNIPGILII